MGRDAPDGRALLHWREDLLRLEWATSSSFPCGLTIGGNQVGRPVGPGLSETARRPHHSVVRLPLSQRKLTWSIKTLMHQPRSGQQEHPEGSSRRLTRECVLASTITTFFRVRLMRWEKGGNEWQQGKAWGPDRAVLTVDPRTERA
jgi:hypothetical protein